MSGYNKSQFSKKINKAFPNLHSNIVSIPHSYVIEEEVISELDSFREQEKKLRVEKKQLMDALDQLQLKSDDLSDKKNRFLERMEKDILSKLENSECRSSYMLFSVFTCGPSWTDGLVFTVMAESEVWAEYLVRGWLSSNGRENHKIDKVIALVSRDTRGIVNVGASLLDV